MSVFRKISLGPLSFLLVIFLFSGDALPARKTYDWKLLDQAKSDLHKCILKRDRGLNSPSYGGQKQASEEYCRCVERIIVDIAKEFYGPRAFGKGGIKARLEEIEKPYREMYETVIMKAGPCGPQGCGAMWDPYPASNWGDDLEILLERMIGHLQLNKNR